MRRSDRTFRNVACLVLPLMISAALAACGGGGGGSSTSPGTSGPAKVSVSIASAPSYPAGTTFASSTSSPATAAPPGNSPAFDNVFVTVTKIALIPSTGPELPDANGELENSSAEEGKGFVTATLDPSVVIDLRHLTGDNAATLLNQFSGVPAGEYSKIRVYYSSVVGHNAGPPPADTTFHQTGNYHFDVHFVGGNLVIPVASNPVGGIRFYSVVIDVVGLKIISNNSNTLLRPQVFAEVVGDPKYIVTGEAAQVNHDGETFVVKAVHDNISVTYGSGTKWFYFDERYVGPFENPGADNALRDTAHVDVIGTFQGGVLSATEVDISFPNTRTGTADNVWILANTAFIVRSVEDNVVVIPKPNRVSAYYDNSTSPFPPLTYTAIANTIPVKTRGYFNGAGDLEAYWISVGP
jgi:Domain of unknown function (DUF4382)